VELAFGAAEDSMGLVKCTSAILRAQSVRAGKQAGGLPRKVGVLGGGFGGLYTALKLEEIARNRGQPLPQVTLIDQGDKFVFKPLLYELLSREYNESEVAIPFKDLLSSSQCVRHTQASVTSISCDEEGPSAQLEGDGSISSMGFDHMIVALGSVVPDAGVPGAKEHAYAFNTLEDTKSVSNRLSELEGQKSVNIAVVGGGFAGTELAASIAKRMQGSARVELITPRDVLPAAAEKQREIGRNKLERLGVALVQGKVTQIDSDGFELTRGSGMEAERRPADLVLWTVGSKAALPESHGFRLGSDGRILVEPTLRARQCASTFALGDAASSSSPATAQASKALHFEGLTSGMSELDME